MVLESNTDNWGEICTRSSSCPWLNYALLLRVCPFLSLNFASVLRQLSNQLVYVIVRFFPFSLCDLESPPACPERLWPYLFTVVIFYQVRRVHLDWGVDHGKGVSGEDNVAAIIVACGVLQVQGLFSGQRSLGYRSGRGIRGGCADGIPSGS